MVPNYFHLVADLELGEVVKRIEGSKRIGPVYIAEAVSGEDNGKIVVFRCAEVPDAPDAFFEDLTPVVALVNLASNLDFVD